METGQSFAETRAARICSWWLLLAAMVCSDFIFVLSSLRSDAYLHMLKDMGMTVPVMTLVVLHPAYRYTLGALAVLGLAKEPFVRNRMVTMVINGIHLLLAVMAYELYLFAVHEPLFTMFDALSK